MPTTNFLFILIIEIEDNDFDSPAPIIPDQEISPYEIGFCHNYGQISYKCEMTGDFGKSLCTETVTQSECDCNGRSNTTVTTRNYLVIVLFKFENDSIIPF